MKGVCGGGSTAGKPAATVVIVHRTLFLMAGVPSMGPSSTRLSPDLNASPPCPSSSSAARLRFLDVDGDEEAIAFGDGSVESGHVDLPTERHHYSCLQPVLPPLGSRTARGPTMDVAEMRTAFEVQRATRQKQRLRDRGGCAHHI